MYKISESEKVLAWLPEETIEPEAKQQLINISKMPFLFQHVAVMPDCHVGKGATVGSVIATQGAIIPAAVGVDIGCGMIAVRTPFKRQNLPESLTAMRKGIERRIPCIGRMPVYNRKIQPSAQIHIDYLKDYAKKLGIDPGKFSGTWEYQLGSLGGGNHFIEIVTDELGQIWAFLHSGSRGVGNKIACYFIEKAQEICKKYFINLEDRDLAYLVEGGEYFEEYIANLKWAQEFALLNRKEMMTRVLAELQYSTDKKFEPLESINCHHNFTQKERHFGKDIWLTRKGAIQAHKGRLGLIPGSMGTPSYVVEGLGNRESFCSSPHGAGRRFSRTKARSQFTLDDFDKAMVGIEARRDIDLLDELPGAYKDIDQVMNNAKELIQVKHKFTQILNVKGN